ncbi:PREDICTED: probably inactive leucine-rich repeat receptor-like protein kinase At5g48380 [Camelina sativa]|uniref:Probably inactive leucine-rich repeat receptor-like protein kinase At5g48380 n=1 Tax=Camelina sativa TaxID=90675 RepID=A0ABM1QLF9_CAMSA|nr:PREDICTED: probably inactive leucine-rich repeat receptor-like protein kinase At5g48380 [Camelina sativa]
MVCIVFAIFFGNSLCLLLLLSSLADANQANIDCLKTFKSQVEDPNGYLSSWDFGNQTAQGFICKFSGVTCWHDDENRVLSIKLYGYGLRGVFPQGINLCADLVGLDLSRNNFSGPLPSNLTDVTHHVTTLDLSYNGFSGEIPVSISNISFLNFLMLQHNQFTGRLPPQLVLLGRLKTFFVADNRLEGPIPKFNSTSINSESFANNLNLCGKPLDDCKTTSTNSRGKVVILAALGGFTVAAFVVGIVLGFLCSTISVERLLFRKSRQSR